MPEVAVCGKLFDSLSIQNASRTLVLCLGLSIRRHSQYYMLLRRLYGTAQERFRKDPKKSWPGLG